MTNVLVVDDEKIERNGIRFLLKERKEEFTISEASNGKEACGILKKEPMDILITDIKMPFMDGIELVEEARKIQPTLEMVIFSGYGDFNYAKHALQAGVDNYVLKPVDPKEFHHTFDQILAKLKAEQEKKTINQSDHNDLEAYFLIRYIYQGTPELLARIGKRINTDSWQQVKAMFLIESDDNFFEEQEAVALEQLRTELKQEMSFLNLSADRELCLLKSPCDYKVFATHMAEILNHTYGEKFYLAAGREISSVNELPEAYRELDMQMENKFYRKDRIYFSEEKAEDVTAEQFLNDSIEAMIEDIHLNDIIHLWEHFEGLRKGAVCFQKYSQIYTKFLFFNLVKEMYVQQHMEGQQLEAAIQEVYEIPTMDEVLKKIEEMIRNFEQHLNHTKDNSRNEVERAKSYIYAHYQEDISVDILAEQVYLSPGYFSYIFKRETGQNLSRFVKEYRIEQARKQLAETNMKIVQICQQTGFTNVSYFCKSFREFFGCTPEQFRKGDLKVE